MQTKQRLDVPLSLKSVSDSGEFEGYGSVFGVKDSHDDVVMSGAFAASLREWSDRKALPALLWQHRMDEPIGVYTEMKEDDDHPLQNMITRAVITAIDTVRKCQTAGLKLIAGEKKENVEHLEPYGFTSAAQNGAEAVVLFPGGDRSHGVAVVVADRRFRLKGLARGEVALYDDQGQSVTLTRAGIVINGGGKPVIFTNATKARFEMPIESTGDIRDNCDSSGKTMAEMRTTYNGHTHKENGDGGGITDKPGQPMS